VAERESGQELGWFFDVYVYRPDLPTLVTTQTSTVLTLEWQTHGNRPFPMPVEVMIGGKAQRVEMPNGRGSARLPAGAEAVVDPNGWLLRTW
jgi:aminopeptidase N